jgi:hypothetical protein
MKIGTQANAPPTVSVAQSCCNNLDPNLSGLWRSDSYHADLEGLLGFPAGKTIMGSQFLIPYAAPLLHICRCSGSTL